jgi:hypothetical protein
MTHCNNLQSTNPVIAKVLDRGPESYGWIKVLLPNGEEAFCHSDTEGTVPVKHLVVGSDLAVGQLRTATKPGPTKYVCNALHINLQPSDLAFRNNPYASDEDFQFSPAPSALKAARKPSVTVQWSLARYEFIRQVAKSQGLSGKYALSQAAAYIVDTCMRNNSIWTED